MKYSQEEIQSLREFMSSGKCDGFICGMCDFCDICDDVFEMEVDYEHELICQE
jgi:hypothetical protein